MMSFSLVCTVCGTVNQATQTHCLACGQVLTDSDAAAALTSAPTVSALANKLLKQRYRVIHVIGKGGMGTVYIGVDTRLGDRLVAIKEMSQNGLVLSERLTAARNFQREAHLLASLQHPNLPSIYDHFEEGQRWYLVMSFIKGQTLADYLEAQNGRLPVAEVLEIGIALCSVLAYLHSCNPPIIFRDLKPPNIMRTVNGHIYLIDFGIARFFKQGKVVDTATQGSSGYASPEQYGTAQTTPRSDLYSLGATLYHLLSGYEPTYTPFNLPPLQSLAPSVPPELVVLIEQMLNLDESQRPYNAEIVKEELQRIARDFEQSALPPYAPSLSYTPVAARSPSALRAGKRVKRKKGLIVGVSAALLCLLCATVYLIIGNLGAGSASASNAVVNAFCDAINSPASDAQAAYQQFSRNYQRRHSPEVFQQFFQRTRQCIVLHLPDANHQAEVSLTMTCTPPVGAPTPPPGATPQRDNPVYLVLVDDGTNGWKIDAMSNVGPICTRPPGGRLQG